MECCRIGGESWSAADAPVGQLAPFKMLISLSRPRDGGVARGPGGPPHHSRRMVPGIHKGHGIRVQTVSYQLLRQLLLE